MSESHQFVPVASWLKFFRGPTCALHGGPSLSALADTGTACFFDGQLSSSDPGQERALEVLCACSESAAGSAQFTLEQDEPRVWWYAALRTLLFALAGGVLCGGFAAEAIRGGLVAAIHGRTRASLRT